MFEHRRVRVAALAIATAVAVPAVSLIATTSAQAGNTDMYKGEVIAKTLTIRMHPTTYGKDLGRLKKGAVIQFGCKVKAVPVDGNRLWYMVLGGGNVPARYVKNIGKAPDWCQPKQFGIGHVTKKPSVNLRQGPTNKSKLMGTAKHGRAVNIICMVNGPKVGGNPNWYQLEDGRFVTAHYVKWSEKWMKAQYCNR